MAAMKKKLEASLAARLEDDAVKAKEKIAALKAKEKDQLAMFKDMFATFEESQRGWHTKCKEEILEEMKTERGGYSARMMEPVSKDLDAITNGVKRGVGQYSNETRQSVTHTTHGFCAVPKCMFPSPTNPFVRM